MLPVRELIAELNNLVDAFLRQGHVDVQVVVGDKPVLTLRIPLPKEG